MSIDPVSMHKKKIITIITMFFPEAIIYLFGSRARGDYTERSDIDIAIDIGKRLPLTERAQIINMIDALNIPQRVEIIDFQTIPHEMKDNIIKEGILWKK